MLLPAHPSPGAVGTVQGQMSGIQDGFGNGHQLSCLPSDPWLNMGQFIFPSRGNGKLGEGSGVTLADVALWVCLFASPEHALIPNFSALGKTDSGILVQPEVDKCPQPLTDTHFPLPHGGCSSPRGHWEPPQGEGEGERSFPKGFIYSFYQYLSEIMLVFQRLSQFANLQASC